MLELKLPEIPLAYNENLDRHSESVDRLGDVCDGPGLRALGDEHSPLGKALWVVKIAVSALNSGAIPQRECLS